MEILILASLILINALFAMSEVALLTARKPRLAALAQGGDVLAAAAARLAEEPTRFLSTVQIGITSIGLLSGIVGEAVLAEPLAAWLQGALGLEPKPSGVAATAVVVIGITYFSIVVGELVPKRLGQHNAEGIARLVAWPMRMLATASAPFVSLLSVSTDAILRPLLKLLRIEHQEGAQALSVDEIRTIVLESSNFLPKKHVTILLNLFDLESITVDDVMVPRNHIEAVDLEAPLDHIRQQIATAHHRRLLVYRGNLDEVIGTLRVRDVLNLVQNEELTKARLQEIVREPYFVPAGTPLFSQMQNFQEHQDRVSLVVDEYGELLGLVTLEDLLEEMIGEFTTQSPLQTGGYIRQPDGSYLVEGATLLRELNRKLGFQFPLDGPKTLNGLILEHLQAIPEPNTSLKIAGYPLEIVQTQGRAVKSVRVQPRAGA